MSYDEIAATLGLGRNHVATLIFRGKQQLREKLGQPQSGGFRRNELGLSD
jgi:DNA-directed RNA polymerase specialized sigma24 family protein